MPNTLDIHIEVSNVLPGGEGGAYGAYVIIDVPSSLLKCYEKTENERNEGLHLWHDRGIAKLLTECPIDLAIRPIEEIASNLQGCVDVEPCCERTPGRSRFFVYEVFSHC